MRGGGRRPSNLDPQVAALLADPNSCWTVSLYARNGGKEFLQFKDRRVESGRKLINSLWVEGEPAGRVLPGGAIEFPRPAEYPGRYVLTRVDCPPPPPTLFLPSPVHIVPRVQPFVGLNIGGGFQNTNFSVDPPFNVNGSGVIGGGFGGVLFPIPNTNALAGFRVGAQGSNIIGDIMAPSASPRFTYNVRTNWMAYQEGLAEIPIDQLAYVPTFGGGFTATISTGVAEMGTSVKGTSGMFSVTDSAVRTGITFTAGVGVPVAVFPNGTSIDLFTQYRGTQWIGTVNIPGAVNIGSFTNEVDVGVTLHFGGGVSYTLR